MCIRDSGGSTPEEKGTGKERKRSKRERGERNRSRR